METLNNMEIANNIHEVVAIIDRSGSMVGKEDDTIGGINSTFEVLKEDQDNSNIKVSIKLFDHEENMLIRSLDLKDVKPIERKQYVPRGQTALLDAIGNTLNYFMEKKLSDTNAYNCCTIYVVTDGYENSSKNYNSENIKSMIANAENNFNIKILYLAANQDAILEASKFGIDSSQALNYDEDTKNVLSAYRSAASAARRHSSSGEAGFTNVERTMSQPETNNNINTNIDHVTSINNLRIPLIKRQRSEFR